jgi:4-amino-4-deoxy-L-arabinose transferase-like glycosyltransferase
MAKFPATQTKHLPMLPVWFVLLLGYLVLVSGSGTLPLLDRDEPRFSRATVEMAERGDWFIPYFNGEYRFDKPPLTYWLMAVHQKLLGVNELSCRLHAIEATLLVAFWMCLRGRRWVGKTAAGWGALAWCLNVQVWQHGRLALADMPMVLGLCLAMDGLWTCLKGAEEEYRTGRLLLWVGLAFGFLAKGPIALAIPAGVWLALIVTKHTKAGDITRTNPVVGILAFLVVVGAWGIPALVKTGGEFAKVGLGEHVLERGVSAFNSRKYTPFFYLGTFFLSFFPWWLQGRCAAHYCKENKGNANVAFLLAWGLAPVLVFTCYSTQLPHYILPGFPALFLLLGAALENRENPTLAPWGALVATGILLAAYLAKDKIVDEEFPMEFVPWLALVLAGFAWLPFLSLQFGKWGALATSVVLAIANNGVSHEFARQHLTLKIRDAAGVTPDMVLPRQSSTFAEPSLVFYLGGPWEFGGETDIVPEGLRVESLDGQTEGTIPKGGIVVEGFNPGKGRLGKVAVFPPTSALTHAGGEANAQ